MSEWELELSAEDCAALAVASVSSRVVFVARLVGDDLQVKIKSEPRWVIADPSGMQDSSIGQYNGVDVYTAGDIAEREEG